MELCVSWATAFTPTLATACTPTGTLDLIPRLGSLLGPPTCQPLPGRLPGLQDADQRHGCSGPMGTRGRALSGPGHTPHSSRLRGAAVYTGTRARQASAAASVSPRDRHPPLGDQEHYTAQEAFTLDGGATPPTPATCRSPDLPAPLGPDTVPSWLGGPEPVSGNCPQEWRREEGRCRGEGPASAVTSTFDQVLLLWPLTQDLVPEPLPWGSSGTGALWVPFCCPSQG